ncbi:glycoside hydrolase family 23 protein [Collybiopsis luxurians FD-317 M1]|nr:glycoside hydrolase family 23 protein [Collybiopsis luxurians FD-317 M1]
MKNRSFVLALLCAAITTVVASSHNVVVRSSHQAHARHARRSGPGLSRRCKPRQPPTPSTPAVVNNAVQISSSSSSSSTWSSTPASSPTSSNNNGQGIWSGAGSLLSVASSCGEIGATLDITSQSGPNGNIYWLNCGVGDQGWNPSKVTIDQLVLKDFATALQDSNSPFKPCSAFTDKFYQYGQQYNIPPIILASFALQESSCNPATVGGAGEQGLMQLTHDKCTNAPGGNCQDIDYNISTGASYFRGLLDSNNGDVLLSIGSYNGWFRGMTVGDATASANTGCCRCQNNLDYLHQFLNGWCQNVNAYQDNLGMYHNLDSCPV